MKHILAAFFTFSRMQRMGALALAILVVLFMIFRTTMALWVYPARNAALERRMDEEYTVWKAREDSAYLSQHGGPVNINPASGDLFVFDPNTIDSTSAIRLGIPPRAVHGLISWRSKGKHFYKPEDLKPLYNLPPEVYARIAPYIRIAASEEEEEQPRYSFKNDYPPIPEIIDLNTADSTLLDRGIRGIGATLAHKIIARRTALGGYLRHEQLLEVYKFPDTTFQMLKEKLRIDATKVRKLRLNTASEAELSAHPYIGEKTAKNIVLFRSALGRYDNVQQLRQVPLMTEEIYRKIAPYCSVE